MLNVSEPLPSFTLQSHLGGEVMPQQLLGQHFVIFVYPKDDTYG